MNLISNKFCRSELVAIVIAILIITLFLHISQHSKKRSEVMYESEIRVAGVFIEKSKSKYVSKLVFKLNDSGEIIRAGVRPSAGDILKNHPGTGDLSCLDLVVIHRDDNSLAYSIKNLTKGSCN